MNIPTDPIPFISLSSLFNRFRVHHCRFHLYALIFKLNEFISHTLSLRAVYHHSEYKLPAEDSLNIDL